MAESYAAHLERNQCGEVGSSNNATWRDRENLGGQVLSQAVSGNAGAQNAKASPIQNERRTFEMAHTKLQELHWRIQVETGGGIFRGVQPGFAHIQPLIICLTVRASPRWRLLFQFLFHPRILRFFLRNLERTTVELTTRGE